ncbi:MAG: hypothetical protein F6J97_01030 [Leptolyngbya sp. SIO4C1]|nr:hypothetical protein [Leptolyngbya sp. SIO4C1]
MDEQALAQQLAKTGNLLDLLNADPWGQADDWDGSIEAGLDLKAYVEQLDQVPVEAYRLQRWYVRLLSILWPELKTWLQSWNLGLSFEAVYTEAKQRVYQHIKELTPEQTDWMNALLAEDEQRLPVAERQVRAQVVPMLSALLTPEDHQALANIAAQDMAKGVLLQVKAAPSAAV